VANTHAVAISAGVRELRRKLVASCLLVLASFTARVSAAEAPRVLVLERAGASALEHETLSRLKGELRSLDFEVITLELDAARDPQEAVDVEGSQLAPFAALTLAAHGSGLRLWMSDRASSQLLVQDWSEEDARLPATVAVQSVELVRARLAASREVAPPTADVVAPPAPLPPSPGAPGLRFEPQAGMALAIEPGAAVTSYMPVARLLVSTRLGAAFSGGLRLGAGALGSALSFEATGGSARVTQTFVLLDAWLGIWPEARVRPYATVGAGVDRRHVEGDAEPGYVPETRDLVSPLASAGVGVFAELAAPLGVSLDAQGLFAGHPARVRIDSTDVATLGRPSLLLSLALVLTP
jgi:hypothetical protein